MSGRDLYILIDRVLSGSATDRENAQFEERLQNDPEFASNVIRHASLVDGLGWEEVAKRAAGSARPSMKIGFSRVAIWTSIAAVMLVSGVVAAVFAFALGSDNPEVPASSDDGPRIVSVIDSTGHLMAGSQIKYPGDDAGAGVYQFNGDSAELLLTSRVSVAISGRTQLQIDNPMHARLHSGAVSFTCPPQAKGFTVQLPNKITVTDLGTRFYVASEPDKFSVVRVDEGRVLVDAGRSITLDTGDAILKRPNQEVIVLRSNPLPGETIAGAYAFKHGVEASLVGPSPRLNGPAIQLHSSDGIQFEQPGQFLSLSPNPLADVSSDWMIDMVVRPERSSASTSIVVYNGDPNKNGIGVVIHQDHWHLLRGSVGFDRIAPVVFNRNARITIIRRADDVLFYIDDEEAGAIRVPDLKTPSSEQFLIGGTPFHASESYRGLIESVHLSILDATFDPTKLDRKATKTSDDSLSPTGDTSHPSFQPVPAESAE